jgi:hypothetical protein
MSEVTKDKLIELTMNHSIYQETLDELVHETASVKASTINSLGTEEQLNYLLENGIDLAYIEGIFLDEGEKYGV